MTGPVLPADVPIGKRQRRGAKPRPRTYTDPRHKPPYSQDRMWWPSATLGTYRKHPTQTEVNR